MSDEMKLTRLRVADHGASDKRIALEVEDRPLDVVGWVDNDDVPEGYGEVWASQIVRAVNAFGPMRDALLAVQWQSGDAGWRCPCCCALRKFGHDRGCVLAAALRAADEAEEGR